MNSNNRVYYSHEAELQVKREKIMLILIVTGLSVSLATLIGFLFAPQAGDETRGQLSEHVSEVVSKAKKVAGATGEQLMEKAEAVRETVDEQLKAAR
ncbi:hypothetical protein MASR2M15_03590 [Anaerolineales bacterium]|jgi:gas vesicle protein